MAKTSLSPESISKINVFQSLRNSNKRAVSASYKTKKEALAALGITQTMREKLSMTTVADDLCVIFLQTNGTRSYNAYYIHKGRKILSGRNTFSPGKAHRVAEVEVFGIQPAAIMQLGRAVLIYKSIGEGTDREYTPWAATEITHLESTKNGFKFVASADALEEFT